MPFSRFDLFPNTYFIETGSYRGDGIQAALDCGFKLVVSIEVTEKYYKFCENRFIRNDNVILYRGSSLDILPLVLKRLGLYTATFWLDGHWSGDDTGFSINKYPILDELDIIKSHEVKSHTILIDDARLFNTEWNIGLDNIIKKLHEINPFYKIDFYDGYIPKDVLVAHL